MIGDAVTDYIQEEMKSTYGLEEVLIPEDKHLIEENLEDFINHPKSNIYMSKDFKDPQLLSDDNEKGALILIQGTGAVRAG